MPRRKRAQKRVETLVHDEAKRTNIPTAEYSAALEDDDRSPIEVAYERRNRDLDPQLVWRGKDQQDASGLLVQAPPLYIQEKVHPKVLVDDLMRRSGQAEADTAASVEGFQFDLFSDFNGLPEGADRTDFYEHDANWSNRMILGDSLQVMASLAEREGLRGKVQCIYIDPPYGIKFNSNFQWSTTSRDVRDGKAEHITREPEQVKAFRDTWRDGIHSYLSYLRDRLEVARDLLADSGSVFVQIGEENVHRVRALMDEVLGEDNFVSEVVFLKTTSKSSSTLDSNFDMIVWFAKDRSSLKFRKALFERTPEDDYNLRFVQESGLLRRRIREDEVGQLWNSGADFWRPNPLTSQTPSDSIVYDVDFEGKSYSPGNRGWSTSATGMTRLQKADRLVGSGKTLSYIRYLRDAPMRPHTSFWTDTRQSGFGDQKTYVVQTARRVIERCILMSTDPGDLVLDPTCGSGTTAYVAEQWGRRWITIDTSRVALALARARVMGARYPYYLLSDSVEGTAKEAEIARVEAANGPAYGDIRQGFVYERVPHIQLRDIANNAEIDVIWERFQDALEPLRSQLNATLGEVWEEWEIPSEAEDGWSAEARALHVQWWEQRIARQREIDASIAAKADFEYLYDKPYEDRRKVRVAGPFTVESLSPHRVLGIDEDDELIDGIAEAPDSYGTAQDFGTMVLDHLRTAGVQQAHKEDRIEFSSVTPWPGEMVCAEGRYAEGGARANGAGAEKRAGIFIGPEFGTVSRPDLVEAAREAADAGFDALIACAFNYEAHATDFNKLGRVPVLKARMNADLHMAGDLKNTGKGNLFVIFGEPDIDIIDASGDDDAEPGQVKVRVNGVDVFHPNTGEVRSDGPEGIACWFIDTDYNQESFFVRHAYFLGQNDPYKALKTTLKAEIDEEAWETLQSDSSRPFDKPASGRIAVKVINHLGDEVMKVFRVD
ncbi:MAG: site-specific DNA-methyltransferase [Dehalococcoidia bacterium]|nr:site-specific DNA-methyltransferase [Dehalococcoidia bacterium]MYA54441.1 site-specific DNA-methyltransferase [Dehalococcoidia bacterium]